MTGDSDFHKLQNRLDQHAILESTKIGGELGEVQKMTGREDNLMQITDFNDRLTIAKPFDSLAKGFFKHFSHSGIRRVATGNPEDLRRYTELIDELKEIRIFAHHNGTGFSDCLENGLVIVSL
ncbi:hypothetical protein BIU88_08475 [Chlorobaculum limnaeum]|uniref:Uncharacterized protein n=1 Tax=Chlorobaculum limnaeum TaxID=274537 RepID=A0A1D8D8X3_CHLLM|nr:hypothetical protein BIU88_08475 [Chlorobaculum limnaeum]